MGPAYRGAPARPRFLTRLSEDPGPVGVCQRPRQARLQQMLEGAAALRPAARRSTDGVCGTNSRSGAESPRRAAPRPSGPRSPPAPLGGVAPSATAADSRARAVVRGQHQWHLVRGTATLFHPLGSVIGRRPEIAQNVSIKETTDCRGSTSDRPRDGVVHRRSAAVAFVVWGLGASSARETVAGRRDRGGRVCFSVGRRRG
jgi:hypothetical protein